MLNNIPKKYYIIIFIAAVALYANTLKHSYVLDDNLILKNSYVLDGFRGVKDIFSHGFMHGVTGKNELTYRPIVLLSFAIESQFFGGNSTVGHFVNVLLFAMCGVLLFYWLSQLFRPKEWWLTFLMTLLFIAHPIHTEVVANVKSRDEILLLFFLLLMFIKLFHYVKGAHQKKSDLYWSLGFYFCALLSKEVAITFIVIIPLTLFFFNDFDLKKVVTKSLPYLGVLGICVVIRHFVLQDAVPMDELVTYNNGLLAAESYVNRYSTALLIIGMYIGLLFFPHPLSWDYSYPQIPIVGPTDFSVIAVGLLLVGLLVLTLAGFKKKSVISYCILFFFISISTTSNLVVLIGATLGERFLFVPSIAFAIAIPLVLVKVFKVSTEVIPKKNSFYFVFCVIILLFSIKLVTRNSDWKTEESLFLSGVEGAPNSSRTIFSLANFYRTEGEKSLDFPSKKKNFDKAILLFEKSVALHSDNFEAWYNMGVTYSNMQQSEKAYACFKKAITANPEHLNSLNNIGVYYISKKDYINASLYFSKATRVDPNWALGWYNLGVCYYQTGDYSNALKYCTESYRLDPNDPKTKNVIQLANNKLGISNK